MLDLKPLVHAILDDYPLPWDGTQAFPTGHGCWKTGCGLPRKPGPPST